MRSNWLYGIYNKKYCVCNCLSYIVCSASFISVKFIINTHTHTPFFSEQSWLLNIYTTIRTCRVLCRAEEHFHSIPPFSRRNICNSFIFLYRFYFPDFFWAVWNWAGTFLSLRCENRACGSVPEERGSLLGRVGGGPPRGPRTVPGMNVDLASQETSWVIPSVTSSSAKVWIKVNLRVLCNLKFCISIAASWTYVKYCASWFIEVNAK